MNQQSRTIRTAEIIGFYSLPSPSLAEHNPTAYNLAMQAAPRGAGSCSHCGRGIVHHVIIRDENSVVRAIGTDCAAKVGFDADQIAIRLTDAEKAERNAARERRLAETDWSVFQFGKYEGRGVRDVFAEDPDYVEWFAGQVFFDAGKLRTQAICVELVAPVVAARKAARQSTCAALVAALGEENVRGAASDGDGFAHSVCSDLLNGVEPSYRAVRILVEIFAKYSGRRNSKTYRAAYDTLSDAVEEVYGEQEVAA